MKNEAKMHRIEVAGPIFYRHIVLFLLSALIAVCDR